MPLSTVLSTADQDEGWAQPIRVRVTIRVRTRIKAPVRDRAGTTVRVGDRFRLRLKPEGMGREGVPHDSTHLEYPPTIHAGHPRDRPFSAGPTR